MQLQLAVCHEPDVMNKSPYGLYFAAHHSSCLCCRVCTSLDTRNSLLITQTRAIKRFPVVLHGVGRRRESSIVCDVHTFDATVASRGKLSRKCTPTHGKPASFGRTKAKKRMPTQKEAEIEKGPSKLAPAKPSEGCIVRLFEQQPLRLQNNDATFLCTPQEANTLTHKAPRMEREKFYLYANGSSKVESFNEDVFKPDFSRKLLDILSSFKSTDQFSDVKSTRVIDSQPVEENLGQDALQRHPQSNVFVSPKSQSEPAVEMKRLLRTVDETLVKGTQLAALQKAERDNTGMLDSSKEDNMGSVLVCKGPEDSQLAFEGSGFSSEFSDDNNCNAMKNRQAIEKQETVSLQHASGPSEHKRRLLSDSAPLLYGKGWSHVFPRHFSRSTGSRSSPSRSSIPGLRSKYSKPDPRAKKQVKKPLQLLANFEEETESINRSVLEEEDEEDDVTLQTFEKGHKQPETELEEQKSFGWWDSDEEDDLKCRLPMTAKFSTGSSITNSKMEIKSHILPQVKSQAEDLGSLSPFEKRTETKPEEYISFQWSDSDEEGDLKLEDDNIFEWSDSDAESNSRAEIKSFFEGKVEDTDLDVDSKSGLFSTSQHPLSPEIEATPAWLNKGVATSNSRSSSDQALSHNNRADNQDPGSNTYSDCNFSVTANWKSTIHKVHQLPPSVKFVEAPSWKKPILPDFPFEINYSYSEIPKAPILGFRDHFSPFAPKTMERPWTGGAHKKPRNAKGMESFNHALERKKAFELTFNRRSKASKQVKSREEILGKPLTKDEIISLVQNCHEENRQVNLGRDGLTHNMIHLIHSHWKRRPVCKIKCRGVPTMDMDNVCFHVEDKTGGQIIYRSGGTVYVFRGRNYIYEDRPVVPFMLFRPASPVYPKLVPQAPAGLTIDEAHQLRILGQKVKPLLKLRKNAVLLDLIENVRDAFQVDDLVALDYTGVQPYDYRQIGAKLMELVPCVLLSFRNNRIVLWKGRDSKTSSVIGAVTCADGASLNGEPMLEATDVEDACVYAAKTMSKSSGDASSFSKADAELVDEDMLPVLKEKSTELHHSERDSVFESNLMDGSDVISDHGHAKVQSHKAARDIEIAARSAYLAGCNTRDEVAQETLLGDVEAVSVVLPLPDDLPLNRNEHAELSGGGGEIESALSDASASNITFPVSRTEGCHDDYLVGGTQGEHLHEEDLSSFTPSTLDNLWEGALDDGLAVHLESIDLEADLILHKVTVFSEVAPSGPVYTDKLVNRLRLFGLYKKLDNCFVVPLHIIRRRDRVTRHRKQPIKIKVAKCASCSPNIETPARKGLQTDDLVKKLGCV